MPSLETYIHRPTYIPVADLEKINKGWWLEWDGVNWPVVQWSRELKSKMSLCYYQEMRGEG